MKKKSGISLESEKWDALQVEADKRKISRNELFDVMTDLLLANQPLISEVVDLDKQIKEEKLAEIKQNVRKKTNDNDFFEKHGYYPTKPANFVTRVVEQIPSRQTEWTGDQYKKQTQQPQKEATYEPEISLEDWKLVFPTLTDFDKEKNMHKCIVQNCCQGFQNAETARRHIIDNHESVLQDNLREMKRMMQK
ncbi:MAG: hypothetical protein ACYDAJ_02565 [Nitrosotalea sp.]